MLFSSIKKVTAILALVLSMAFFVGCGDEKTKIKEIKEIKEVKEMTEEEKITNVAKGVTSAMSKGDLNGMMKYTSKEAQKEYKELSKAEKEMTKGMIEGAVEEMNGLNFKFGKITFDNNNVAEMEVIIMTDDDKDEETFDFVKEDGKWVIDMGDMF